MVQHNHNHSHHSGQQNIAIAFFLNLGFTVIEIVGGLLTNSLAIQSDALHDAGDTISLGLAWYFQKLSRKERTQAFTFGFKRFNTLGAMITGTILAAGSVYILMESIPRLFAPVQPKTEGMILLAVLGVIVNGIAVLRLRKGEQSLNETMISWHLIEDVLGWIAVLAGSILMYFFDIPWLDPALSILITLYILKNVIANMIKTFRIILQATPDSYQVAQIRQRIMRIPEIEDAHHIHIWTLDGEYHLFSAHIVTSATKTLLEIKPIKDRIQEMLETEFSIQHITLEFEMVDECKNRNITH